MPNHAGPKNVSADSLLFAFDMGDERQSYQGYPIQNFVSSTTSLYRYNNPGFSGYNTNTGRVHPITGTAIWELGFYPQDSGRVPRLASTEGFGCYHGMGTALESGKIYLASIMVKEGPGTEIFNNYINHGYSNIGGWNSNGTTNTREYVGDGWWRFYTLWNNQTTAYSEDGVTPLATRYMSNYYTTFDLPAGESIVESVAMNFAAYVGNTPYRGTYNIVSSVQDDYNGVGVTILDWGIDSSMTKPEYTPVFNYPDPNFSRTLFYRINMGAAGRCRIRTYTYGVSISLTDSKYWKMTFRDTELNKKKIIFVTAPMLHEVPSLNYKKPWVYVDGTRTGGLTELINNTSLDVSTSSKAETSSGFEFDGTNDYVALGNPENLRELTAGSIEAVYYRTASTGTYQMIFTDAGSDLEITYSGNVLQFYIGNSGLSYTHAVTGQWFHVVGTWGPGFKKMYINGVEVASGTNTGIDTGNRDRYIGGRGTSFPFNGKIPMVKVYSRTLTASEVASNYNAVKSRFNI